MTLNSRGGECSGYYRDEKGFLRFNGRFVGGKAKKGSTRSVKQYTFLFIPVEESLLDQVPVVHDREGRACVGYLVTDHHARLLAGNVWREGRDTSHKRTNVYVDLIQGQPVSSKENIALLISRAMQYGAIVRGRR